MRSRSAGAPSPSVVGVALCVIAVLAMPAAAQTVLFEDGELTGWVTTPRNSAWQITGAQQGAGGNPGSHYLVSQTHRNTDPFAPTIASTSVFEGRAFQLPGGGPSSRLEFQVDLLAEDPQPMFPQFPPELTVQAVVVQSARTFFSQDTIVEGLPTAFQAHTLVVARTRFRAADGREPIFPDFSPNAPALRFGLSLGSTAIVDVAGGRTIRIRIDNVRVRLLPPAPPAPDLWVTKTDGLTSLCEEVDIAQCGAVSAVAYTIRYGNRGTRRASGVVVTDHVPSLFRGIGFETSNPWQCLPRANSQQLVCTHNVGALEPGQSGEVVLMSRLGADGISPLANERGLGNVVTISDDGTQGADQDATNNRAVDFTGGQVCSDPFSGVVCCALDYMRYLLLLAESSGPVKRLAAVKAGILETVEDMQLFYRVREEVLERTPGGRRAIDLYYRHTTEISRHLAQDADLRDQALSTLSIWKPSLEALVAGQRTLPITAPQVAAIQTFLADLEAQASPELRQVIDREARALGLGSLAGRTLDQGLARLERFTCQPDETTLCFGGGRFRVDAAWRTPQGRAGRAQAVPLTGDAGYFWFFGEANVEALVKLVDACSADGHFWFFGAGLTNVDVTLAVADTWTGQVRNYRNPLGTPFKPLQDTRAFRTCSAAPPAAAQLGEPRAAPALTTPARPAARVAAALPAGKAHACVPGPEALCLQGGRFRVETEWQAPNGTSGRGRAVALTPDTGYFWFFAPDNVEEVVKVLDACALNNRRWVFAAGLTNLRVVTRVTDTHTGAVKTYTNRQGRPFQPLQDTQAFGGCS